MRHRVWITVGLAVAVVIAAALLVLRSLGMFEPRSAPPARVASQTPRVPPEGVVPEPRKLAVRDLGQPECINCAQDRGRAARPSLWFRTDLDALAPLGNGSANAAIYFRDFAAMDGERNGELQKVKKLSGVDLFGIKTETYAFDERLLLEAEPWVDQATLHFYPDVWPVRGGDTQAPQLLHFIRLARTWVARGLAAHDHDAAAADFRRAIRLGRLLQQDDVLLISHLIAMACVRQGVQGLYELARREDDVGQMLLTGRVLGEYDAIRGAATALNATLYPDAFNDGLLWNRVKPGSFDQYVHVAQSHPDRCMRLEAMIPLVWAASAPLGSQASAARRSLEALAGDKDPLVRDQAKWLLGHPLRWRDLYSS